VVSTASRPYVSPRSSAPPARRRRRRGPRPPAFVVVARVLLVGWVAFNLFLLVWIVATSLKSSREVFGDPLAVPTDPQWDNYAEAWNVAGFSVAFLNSVLVVAIASVVVVTLAAPAAYMLARARTRTASPLTSFFAVGTGIPLQAIVIPIFVLMQSISSFFNSTLGWWDDRISLTIIYVATSLPFAIFLLTGFFRSLPYELEEAAALDGASVGRVFVKVMLPLAQPGLITALVLTVVSLWNETLLALILVVDTEQQTLPQALLGLYGTMQYTSNWGGLFAGLAIVVLPVVLVYWWLGRHIIEGLTVGAGK
jgi:N-acetylglucosamine transport system permease protein